MQVGLVACADCEDSHSVTLALSQGIDAYTLESGLTNALSPTAKRPLLAALRLPDTRIIIQVQSKKPPLPPPLPLQPDQRLAPKYHLCHHLAAKLVKLRTCRDLSRIICAVIFLLQVHAHHHRYPRRPAPPSALSTVRR